LKKTWLALILSFLPLLALAGETLTLGVFAYRPKPVMAGKFDMLGTYLSAAIPGHTVRVEYLDHAEMNAAIAAGRIDLIFTNPAHYIQLRHGNRLSGAMATLQSLENGQATAQLGGVIITRSDSHIQGLQDIRGSRLATPGTGAMFLGGYQTQAYELQLADIHLPDDVSIIKTGSHDKVVRAVLAGEADAGFVRTGILETLMREGTLRAGELRVVNPQQVTDFPFMSSTRLYPEWVFAASPGLPEAIVKAINRALLAITPDMAVARSMEIHGFTIPGDYQSIDQLTRALRLPPYETPDFSFADVWQRYQWHLLLSVLSLLIISTLALRLWHMHRNQTREAERLRAITDTIADGIYVADKGGRITLVNPAFTEILGYSVKEVIGAIGHDLFHSHGSNPIPQAQCPILETTSSGHAYHGEVQFRRRNGSLLDIEIAARPIRDPTGQVTGSSVTAFRDISERKRTEAELRQHRDHLEGLVEERTAALSLAKESAESASRAKSTFLSNMSHELRTPMNAIMGMTCMILRQSGDPQLRVQLGKIEAASKHLLHVINDILDISKIEADRMKLEEIDFLLGSVFENLNSLTAHRAAEKGLMLNIELPDELAGLSLIGDPLRLGQVLLNLTGNAIKFTEHGHVTIRGKHKEIHDDQHIVLRFEVEDSGIGIAPEAQRRLFTAFEQADNTMTRKYGGSGLGLAISKQLVQLMGGEMGINSVPGQGSTFWFTIRFRLNDNIPVADTQEHGAEQSICREFPGARILLAEDEPINREVSLGLLEDCGLCVDIAEDGCEALSLARREHYDLILMDIQMPTMNGVEATLAIRDESLNRDTPIIAMTANAFAEDRLHCLETGMNDHIGKPVSPERLFETLLKWLRQARRATQDPARDSDTPA